MPVRRNQYYSGYNDPSIGKAIGSLGALFAPPDASDMASIATAKATNDKNARLAELFTNRDAYTKDQFDRAVAATGQGNISSGYYGVDTTAATSRANNAAEQARALQQTSMQQEGETLRSLFTPVAQDAARFVPPAAAKKYGISEIQQGNVSAAPGETVYSASGQTYAGAPKPQTAEDVKGAELQRMLNSQDPADKALARNIVAGSAPVETIQTPTGPQIQPRTAAYGQTPAPDTAKETVMAAVNPKGDRIGPAVLRGGKLINPQNGAAYPDDVAAATLSVQAQTPGALGSKGPTEAQHKAAFAYRTTNTATENLLNAYDAPNGEKLPTGVDDALRGLASVSPVFAQGQIKNQMSPQGQEFMQEIQTVLPMQLMIVSGAAVNEEEYRRKMQNLIPVKGEAPAVTAQKRRQLAEYRDAIREYAGPALTESYGDVSPGAAKSGGVSAAASAPSVPGNTGTAPSPAAPAASADRVDVPDEAAAMALPPNTKFRITKDGRTGTAR